MNECRIQYWDSIVLIIIENQRKFCSGQKESVDTVTVYHLLYDYQEAFTRFRKHNAIYQLIHINTMNKILLFSLREGECHPSSREYRRIEVSLHGGADAKQPDFFQTEVPRPPASGFHTAAERNWCLLLNIITDNVRAIASQ